VPREDLAAGPASSADLTEQLAVHGESSASGHSSWFSEDRSVIYSEDIIRHRVYFDATLNACAPDRAINRNCLDVCAAIRSSRVTRITRVVDVDRSVRSS